jgi:hypothetical protein
MRRRIIRVRLPRAVLAAGAATALAAALGGCAPDITQPRVEGSLGSVFAHLYVHQQALLGHPGLTPATVGANATCHRNTPGTHNTGAGSDWICQVRWTDSAGQKQDGTFELQVRANGCYQATGPARIVGPLTIHASTGKDIINPVSEFDGCFDTT